MLNKDVIDYCNQHGKQECVAFLSESNNDAEKPSQKSYYKSIEKLSLNSKTLKKSANREKGALNLEAFLSSIYKFPQCENHKRVSKVTSNDLLDLNASFKREKDKNVSLMEETTDLKEKNECLDKSNFKMESKLDNCKLNLKRTAGREKYALNKIQKMEEKVKSSNCGECCEDNKLKIAHLESQLLEKNKQIGELEASVDYLQDLLNDNSNNKKHVIVFDEKSRKYTPELKKCVYEMLQNQVSASKVSCVINTVLKMVDIIPNKLPSRTSVLDMNIQRLYLAHAHIVDVFSKEENTALLTDETSKFGTKFMGYEACDSDGKYWVLGLRDIETKSANDTLKVFNQILSDLDDASNYDNKETSKNIVSHIVATMSDRAATEVKFNELLYQFRKEILPLTYHNYHELTDEEKHSIETLCNFFCGLHALVNFAETARSCLKEIETGIYEIPISDKSYKDNDPGSIRLVRTASKAFGEGSGGDEKSGCQGPFKTFVKEFLDLHKLRGVPLRSFRGTRFNILFQNAGALFFLHSQMKDFLCSYGAGNRLLKSILFDLNTVEFVAGIKALGLLSKFITCPLWSILENRDVSIIDMKVKYLELVTFLDDASKDIPKFMRGEMLPFGEDTHIEKGPIYDALLTTSSFDNTVDMMLQVLLPALCKLSRRLFQDHLPGGKLSNLSNEVKQKVKAAPKTSCYAESVFGQLDNLLRSRPSTKTLAAEACIMFLNNKTLFWLEQKGIQEQKSLMKEASRNVKTLREKYKDRLNEIDQNRKIVINEAIAKREKNQKEKIRKLEQFTNDILIHGLWQSEAEIDNMVLSYEKKTEKLEAIKAQLKFRKEVLNQIPDDKTVFNITKTKEGSKSRKQLTVEEFVKNLKDLVRQSIVKDNLTETERHILVGKRIKHRLMIDGHEKWYHGKVISQVPSFPEWFNLIYDNDPAVYTYHLRDDLDRSDITIIV